MQSFDFEPDPQGDVLLVLRRPNLQKLIWSFSATDEEAGSFARDVAELSFDPDHSSEAGLDPEFAPEPQPEPVLEAELMPEPEPESESEPVESSTALNATGEQGQTLAGDGDGDGDDATAHILPVNKSAECTEVKFRLSSRHLSLASRVFRAMLSGGWKESTVYLEESNSTANNQEKETNEEEIRLPYEIGATEWDAQAFLLLMNIIHGHHRKVPSSVDIETLGRFSVLVDYYECYEVTELFVRLWMDRLSKALPTSYGRDSTLWLCVSWVFSNASIFEKMTELAMKESEGPLQTMGLPLPLELLSDIEQKRANSLHRILLALTDLRDGLLKGTRGCGYECSCMLLGSLTKELSKHGLEHGKILKLFPDRSIKQFKSIVLGFGTPVWYSERNIHRYHDRYYPPHHCSLSSMLQPTVDNVWKNLNGLKLDDYRAS